METPQFGGEMRERPEHSLRQEKKERADGQSLVIFREILETVEGEMQEVQTIHFAGREYPISDNYDLRLAREQRIAAHLETRLEQARKENDYYLEQALTGFKEFSELNARVITRSAELNRSYPQSAGLLMHDGEHRDTH